MSANLRAIPRDKLGSRHARRLRAQGRIPASVQGESQDVVNLSIEEYEFMTARRHHEHVFTIGLDQRSETVMVRELQWDPFGESILHVEFRRVVLDRETEAEVELEFSGHPRGGVLNHLVTHVTIAAVPASIPDSIEVEVADLEIGHPLLARDLRLPAGVRLAMPPETPIAVANPIREDVPQEEAPAAAPEESAPEEPAEE